METDSGDEQFNHTARTCILWQKNESYARKMRFYPLLLLSWSGYVEGCWSESVGSAMYNGDVVHTQSDGKDSKEKTTPMYVDYYRFSWTHVLVNDPS